MLTLSPPCGLLPEQQGPEVTLNVLLRSDDPAALIDVRRVGILPPGLDFKPDGDGQQVQVWVTGTLAGGNIPTTATFPYDVLIHFIAIDSSDNSRVRGWYQLPVRP